jgi:multicomponent Na+:H+ antiporter subunit G
MITDAGWLLCSIGILVILLSAIGIIRLPDALTRQHAATKATTVAVMLFSVGTMLIMSEAAWTWRLLVIVCFLCLTLPLASHVLGRAAYREADTGNGSVADRKFSRKRE